MNTILVSFFFFASFLFQTLGTPWPEHGPYFLFPLRNSGQMSLPHEALPDCWNLLETHISDGSYPSVWLIDKYPSYSQGINMYGFAYFGVLVLKTISWYKKQQVKIRWRSEWLFEWII